MRMWKVVVSPRENKNAWESFCTQGIFGIGWCNPREDDAPAVKQFLRIKPGDWVVAHLSSKRSGETFLAVGVGRVTSLPHEVDPGNQAEWDGDFRRQVTVDWLSTREMRLPELFKTCNYRVAVTPIRAEIAEEILRRYGVSPTGNSMD